jgi:hypothetical protein
MSESSWSDGITTYETQSNAQNNIVGAVSYITLGAWTDCIVGLQNKVVLLGDIDIKMGLSTDLTFWDDLKSHPKVGTYVRAVHNTFSDSTAWAAKTIIMCSDTTVFCSDQAEIKRKREKMIAMNGKYLYGSHVETCKSLYRVTSPYIILSASTYMIINTELFQSNSANYIWKGYE